MNLILVDTYFIPFYFESISEPSNFGRYVKIGLFVPKYN